MPRSACSTTQTPATCEIHRQGMFSAIGHSSSRNNSTKQACGTAACPVTLGPVISTNRLPVAADCLQIVLPAATCKTSSTAILARSVHGAASDQSTSATSQQRTVRLASKPSLWLPSADGIAAACNPRGSTALWRTEMAGVPLAKQYALLASRRPMQVLPCHKLAQQYCTSLDSRHAR